MLLVWVLEHLALQANRRQLLFIIKRLRVKMLLTVYLDLY